MFDHVGWLVDIQLRSVYLQELQVGKDARAQTKGTYIVGFMAGAHKELVQILVR